MFNKIKLANILSNINSNYNTMTEFAKAANFNRTYISKYIHQRLDNPPSPKILQKIADTSKGLTTYNELMQICGYGQAIEKTAIEQGAIEYLEGIVNRQEPGWSLVDITLNYIKRLEGGGYMLNTQKDNKNKNATTTQL